MEWMDRPGLVGTVKTSSRFIRFSPTIPAEGNFCVAHHPVHLPLSVARCSLYITNFAGPLAMTAPAPLFPADSRTDPCPLSRGDARCEQGSQTHSRFQQAPEVGPAAGGEFVVRVFCRDMITEFSSAATLLLKPRARFLFMQAFEFPPLPLTVESVSCLDTHCILAFVDTDLNPKVGSSLKPLSYSGRLTV